MRTSTRKRADRRAEPAKVVTWRQGVHLVGSALWCDALRAQELCFVSSALALPKTRKRAGTLLCTQTTLSLLAALGRAPQGAQLLSPLGRPFFWGSLRLELFASGDVPGSASLWVKLPSEERVIYAGQPSEQKSPLVDPLQLRPAETLVLAAPFAPLLQKQPTPEALIERLLMEQAEAHQEGRPLLLRCSSVTQILTLGPLLVKRLGDWPGGGTLKLHRELQRAVAFCQTLPHSPHVGTVAARTGRAGELLWWPHTLPPPPLPSPAREVVLADGLGGEELCRYARGSGAKRVYLTAGYSPEVAAALAAHRIACEPLGPPQQLALFAERLVPASV